MQSIISLRIQLYYKLRESPAPYDPPSRTSTTGNSLLLGRASHTPQVARNPIFFLYYPTVPPSLATEPDCFAVLLCARDTDLCDPTVRPQTGTAALYDTSIKTIQVGSDPDNLSRKLLEDVMLCFYESCCADGVADRMKTVNARPLRRLL